MTGTAPHTLISDHRWSVFVILLFALLVLGAFRQQAAMVPDHHTTTAVPSAKLMRGMKAEARSTTPTGGPTRTPTLMPTLKPSLIGTVTPTTTSRTLVVDRDGRGDYRTIGEAVAEAAAGDLIVVRPGEYRESLVIGKPITLQGAGDPQDVRLIAELGPALDLQGQVLVEGLRIGCTPAYTGTVIAIGAAAEIRGCEIFGYQMNMPMIDIAEDTHPVLLDNVVAGIGILGISIGARAAPVIEGNDMFQRGSGEFRAEEDPGSILGGFWFIGWSDGANPTIRGNRFHDRYGVGLSAGPGAGGLIEDNDFYAGDSPGVWVGGDSVQLDIVSNRFFNHTGNGVLVAGATGQIKIEGNEFYGMVTPAIAVVDSGDVSIRYNLIHDNWGAGIKMRRSARATIEHNVIASSGGASVSVFDGSQATIVGNRIWGGTLCGAKVFSGSQATFQANEIFDNEYLGILVDESSEAHITENHIYGNASYGIVFQNNSVGIVSDNTFADNGVQDVLVQSGLSVEVR